MVKCRLEHRIISARGILFAAINFFEKKRNCPKIWGVPDIEDYVNGLLTVNFLHVSDKVEHFVRVADFVVVPRNNLNEFVGQINTGVSVED